MFRDLAHPLRRLSEIPSLQAMFSRLAAWRVRAQTRSALQKLDPHLLRDIGLPLDEAQGESVKPFWRD
jgi:uncharacterized protein YjiS (DUF1127 family)